MIITSISLVLLAYLLLRCLLPSSLSWKTKILLFFLFCVGIFKHVIMRIGTGSWTPELPYLITIIWSFLQITLILFVVFHIIADVFSLLCRLGKKQINKLPVPCLAGAAIIFTGFGMYSALKVPDVHIEDITLPQLPQEWDGLTIAHISDTHISTAFSQEWLAKLVSRVNAARPDLIAISGDLFDGSPAARLRDLLPLRDLSAPLGVYACLGNHEYYSDVKEWEAYWEKLGPHFLRNEHLILRRNGTELVIAGVTDQVANRLELPAPDITGALQGTNPQLPLLVLAHRPREFPTIAEARRHAGATLQLSGHTHGGQVFGLNLLVRALNKGFLKGEYSQGNARLYISSGAGVWSGFLLRLGVPSSIPLLRLHAAPVTDTDTSR